MRSTKKLLVEAEQVEQLYKQFKSTLTAREKEIISRYYGIDKNVRHSLRELGEMYQVTRERIRQIKVVALNKLSGLHGTK